jgi:hypothetical protein
MQQLVGQFEDDGQLSARWGIVQAANRYVYLLDLDRFTDQSLQDRDLIELANTFSKDIYGVFRSVANDRLLEWMEPLQDGLSAPTLENKSQEE